MRGVKITNSVVFRRGGSSIKLPENASSNANNKRQKAKKERKAVGNIGCKPVRDALEVVCGDSKARPVTGVQARILIRLAALSALRRADSKLERDSTHWQGL